MTSVLEAAAISRRKDFCLIGLATAIEDDATAFQCKRSGDAEADAAGGAGNDGNLPVQHGALWPKTMARKTSRPTVRFDLNLARQSFGSSRSRRATCQQKCAATAVSAA